MVDFITKNRFKGILVISLKSGDSMKMMTIFKDGVFFSRKNYLE